MKKIQEIDSNLAIRQNAEVDGVVFHSVFDAPFEVHGLLSGFPLRRMPDEAAAKVSEGVCSLARHTAGGRVRFRTDSKKMIVRATMPKRNTFPHMTFVGTSCFDIYEKRGGVYIYNGSFITDTSRGDTFNCVGTCVDNSMKDITIDLPLYDCVDEIFIGLDSGAKIEPPSAYRNEKPIVFYGSSITQGGCASRPGMSYEALISRRFDCDYINLGFAGSAQGEIAMADYISSLDMSLFVFDYDHNAPTETHLEKTHEPFFLKIREKHPDLPIIFASKTDIVTAPITADTLKKRKSIIRKTYENALARGDKNVAFIDGGEVFKLALNIGADPNDCTVDAVHPTDLGFACLAKAFGDVITDMLGWEK